MHAFATIRTSTIPGPTIVFDCPACNAAGVAGETSTVHERAKFLGLIPFWHVEQRLVRCPSCGRDLRSRVAVEDLPAMTPAERSAMLKEELGKPASLPARICVIAGLIVGWLPVVGLLVSIAAVIGTWSSRSLWRVFAWIGLAVGLISTIAFVSMLVSLR